MPSQGIVRKSLGEFFVGQGDMIFFDEIKDYSNADLSKLTNAKSFGNVKEDSTQWTGEDISTTTVKNEQGNAITSTVTAGTLAFEAVIADFDNEMVKLLLAGTDINIKSLTMDWMTAQPAASGTAVGFGTKLPIIVRPVAIANETLNKTLVFPKAKIVSNLVIEDKMVAIKISVSAENLNIPGKLETGMVVNGALKYAAAE